MGAVAIQSEERRGFRRICDAVALVLERVDDPEKKSDAQIEVPIHPTHVVSISPNGLRFFHSEAFAAGEEVRVGVGLFPGNLSFTIDGEVMNSGERPEASKTHRFFVGVAFRNMGEEERASLLAHIESVVRNSLGGAVKVVN